MKRAIALFLVALASGLVLPTGDAQINRQRVPVNPYTGGPVATPAANPLTGKAPAGRNPLTGKVTQSGGPYNPLTGKGQSGPPSQGPQSAAQWPQGEPPVNGKAGAGLEALDKAVRKIMDRHGIPGASLAVARNGKLIYARGQGWADLSSKTPVEPETMFGLASLSKPFTALAALLLVERGKLSLNDRAFDRLKHIKAPRGARVDPRLKTITIRQLLNHTGGWDRGAKGDPVTWSPMISRALRVPMPITTEQFISYMMSVRLDFNPGAKHVYSNVGYILLEAIIEQASGERYDTFVRTNVLKPAGIEKAFLSTGRTGYHKGEAHCYLAGSNTQLPPYDLPMARAAAGWTASAVDMVRFLTALDGSRGKKLLEDKTFKEMVAPPPAPVKKNKLGNYPGLGWPLAGPSGKSYGYAHDGHWPGTRTFLKCNAAKGLNWALLFNVSMHPDSQDAEVVKDAARDLQEVLDGTDRFPDLDLFEKYK